MSNEREVNVLEGHLIRTIRKLMDHRETVVYMTGAGSSYGIPELLKWNGGGNGLSGARHIVVAAIDDVLGGDWSEVIKKAIERARALEKQNAAALSEATAALVGVGNPGLNKPSA